MTTKVINLIIGILAIMIVGTALLVTAWELIQFTPASTVFVTVVRALGGVVLIIGGAFGLFYTLVIATWLWLVAKRWAQKRLKGRDD